MWLRNERFQRLGGGFGERFANAVLSQLQLFMLGAHKDPAIVQLVRRVRKERKSLLTAFESFFLFTTARSQRDRPGHMAEVGVFAGASSKLICEARGTATLHLFDTFEGLPESSDKDRTIYRGKNRQYACSLESVQAYLQGYSDVHFYKGFFPDTAGPVQDCTFSFVHLDVDLYESTLACLKFFYPRLNPGGVLLSHDYSLLAGVRAAFDEFLADKPEGLIESPTTQCLFVKR